MVAPCFIAISRVNNIKTTAELFQHTRQILIKNPESFRYCSVIYQQIDQVDIFYRLYFKNIKGRLAQLV